MNNVQLKPIIIAAIVFAVLFCVIATINRSLSPNTGQYAEIIWINASVFLIFIISGYVAASTAKRWGVAYGAVVGIVATSIMAIYYSILSGHINKDFEQHWYLWLAFSVICSGVGGLIWDVKKLVIK